MLTFNYGSPYFWDKVVLTKFISGCRIVWDLICGTSWFYKSKTEKVTVGGKSAILPNWCCLFSIRVLFTHPWVSVVLVRNYNNTHCHRHYHRLLLLERAVELRAAEKGGQGVTCPSRFFDRFRNKLFSFKRPFQIFGTSNGTKAIAGSGTKCITKTGT